MPVQHFRAPRYEAHVTDEWQTDTMVVQVRAIGTNDSTAAIAQVMEGVDGMPTLVWHIVDPNTYAGREHLEPTPGIRLPHDVAVAMARAILTDAGKDADEVERLKAKVEDLEMTAHESAVEVQRQMARGDDLQNQVANLERLVEVLQAAADREARVADHFHESLEHQRRDDRHAQDRRLHPSHVIQGAVNEAADTR